MSQDELVDSHVSEHQCQLAIEALLSHELKKRREAEESELLPEKEKDIWLVLAVKKIHPVRKIKPFKIPIVHPIVDPRTTGVCLITKDPQRQYKDLLETHGIKFISRVVGIEKLKGKFKPFEARRLLLKENGMFLADERVVPLLPRLLGSKWFDAKKQPIPVCLTRKDLKGELERAISSTYMHQNRGSCTAIKVGTIAQTPSQILANMKLALPAIIRNIKGQWENIQNIHIKTNSSVSLPIWMCRLDDSEEGRWGGSAMVPEKKPSIEASKGIDKDASESGEEIPSKGGKKRRIDDPTPLESSNAPSKKQRQKNKTAASKSDTSVPAKPAVASPDSDRVQSVPDGVLKKPSLKISKTKHPTVSSVNLDKTPAGTTVTSHRREKGIKVKRVGGLTKKTERAGKWLVGRSAKEYLLGRKAARP